MSASEIAVTGKKPRIAYKWVVLSCTTLGVLLAVVNASSLLIALPEIFRGIDLDPLEAGNFTYLLWILMGYGLVSAALIVTAGRIGDMYGRVRVFKAGLIVFTLAAAALSLVWSTGPAGALQIVIFRMVQAVGGAMMMANSAAMLTDAFPPHQRGLALGINGMSNLAGSFIGLILGGVLAAAHWRLVFAVNVPIGVGVTIWAFLNLREIGERHPARIDWLGNITFAAGLATLLTGISYGIRPYGNSNMGWGNPFVLGMTGAGVVLLVLFFFVETHVEAPMFNLKLFRIRPFAAGNLAVILSAIANGGMQFLLIMWLQGVWLPLHGYSFEQTPLWAGIYMLPLTLGYLCAGPVSGLLSDRYGARPFSTTGMVLASISFLLLIALPVDFPYWLFALVIFLNGISFGMFASPNTAAIMNSVPARYRGVASGTRSTCNMLGQPLSTSIFFSIMIAGLTAHVPSAFMSGLTAHQVPAAVATQLSQLPPTGYLFAAFLGYNPLKQLLGPSVLAALPPTEASVLVSKQFFPSLIGGPFKSSIVYVLVFSAGMCLVAALASWMRGRKFIHEEAQAAHDYEPGLEIVDAPLEQEPTKQLGAERSSSPQPAQGAARG